MLYLKRESKRKTITMTTQVTLRQKTISGNRKSLYLDYYPPVKNPKNGKMSRREFLGFHIFDKPSNPIDKQHNVNTLQLAQMIRLKRYNEINKPEIYADFEKTQLKSKQRMGDSFIEYFRQLTEARKRLKNDPWNCAFQYLNDYTGGNLTFTDLNEIFCDGFRNYLLTVKSKRSDTTGLSKNSAASYFNRFKAGLRQAYRDGYLPIDLNGRIKSIKKVSTQRNFLTIEEVNQLIKTPCESTSLKTQALFAVLTGLRYSDIRNLTWDLLEHSGENIYIRYRQQKTGEFEILPIPEQAYDLLGDPGEPGERIFKGMEYSNSVSTIISQWVKMAGINKKITFHCFRHSYATLQLGAGTDIFTVSKMLGHKNLRTTQVYTQLVDKLKIQATNRIKLDF